MPISYRIDVERNLVLTTASGRLTDDDILQLKARLVRDPAFTPGMKELADIRNIDGLDVTPAGIQAMVQQDRNDSAHLASHKLAIVLSDDVAFGMARMYQTRTESSMGNVGVFRDIEEARTWLQLK
jgi:hypothetical protein